MVTIYILLIKLFRLAIGLASLFSPKAKKWIVGRRNWRKDLREGVSKLSAKPIWIHVSSVGEYEQGKPVISELKHRYPNIPLVLTFFSPSGYETLKDSSLADQVYYLPLDGAISSSSFIKILQPRAAIFVKYEFWYFYYKNLKNRNIPFALISSKFRPSQDHFKWYGMFHRRTIRLVDIFFVQDEESKDLLASIGVDNVVVSGDTRVDRVAQTLGEQVENGIVKSHVGEFPSLILGSAWKTELEIIIPLINEGFFKGWKIVIAPHEVGKKKIAEIEKKLKVFSLRYTLQKGNEVEEDVPVLIIDCIGILKQIYRYGRVAFIGGGFRDGIHNILEPAVFGLPVVFGPKHHKFPEAKTLIDNGGGFEVNSSSEFRALMERFMNDHSYFDKASSESRQFIEKNKGATERVMSKLVEVLHVE